MPVLLSASYIVFASCCNESDLQHLHFKLRDSLSSTEDPGQRLYLTLEVSYVSQVVKIEEKKRQQKELQQQLLKRKPERRMECVVCGRAVLGSYHGVQLTICCAQCCERTRKGVRPMPALLPASYITFASCYNESDLQHLHFKLRDSLSDAEDPDQRLYLAAEVRYVSQVVRTEELHEKMLRRKQELLTQLHITNDQLAGGNRVLWNVLLGDYLKRKAPQTELASVLERFAELNRATEILETNPCANPEAVFDFCLSNPEGGPEEFRELKTKVCSVFRLEGPRIFQHLTDLEIARLIGTPLEEEARRLGGEAVSRHFVLRHLRKQVGYLLAEEIMADPLCQRYFKAGKDESKIAYEMLECWGWILKRNERRVKMEKAFFSRRLPTPRNSIRCTWYVEHKMDYDPDELVSLHYPLNLLGLLDGQDRGLAREPALLLPLLG